MKTYLQKRLLIFVAVAMFIFSTDVLGEVIFSWDCENAPAGQLINSTSNQPFSDVNRYANIITNISDSISHSGSKSIQLGYPNDEAGVELQVNGFGPSPTLYTRKYEYFAPGWEGNWPIGLKTSRYFTGQDSSYAYMSEKLIWQSYDSNCNEEYGMGMNNAIGDCDLEDWYESYELFNNHLPYIRTGHWYKFETWMVLNSAVDVPDGVLKIWIDDILVYSNEALAWKETSRGRVNGDGWIRMWFGGNYSGAICGDPDRTLYRYIDDLYLSTTLDRETEPSVCGNGVIEGDEVCDGDNVGGRTCDDEGFTGDTTPVTCNANCSGYDSSQCPSAPQPQETEHIIAPWVTMVDGNTFDGGVAPGDRLVFESGIRRNPIYFRNLQGSTEKPIIITNDSGGEVYFDMQGQAIPKHNSTIYFTHSRNVKLLGNGSPDVTYGIHLNSDARAAGVGFKIETANIEMAYVWIDNTNRPGVIVNDKKNTADTFSHGTVHIHHNKFTQIGWNFPRKAAAMYIGNNSFPRYPNIEQMDIHDNYIEKIGGKAIQVQSAPAGRHRIHHNFITNGGWFHDDNDSSTAILINHGARGVELFANTITNYSGMGMYINDSDTKVYNNVIHDVGNDADVKQHGIHLDWAQRAKVYNNTITNTGGDGIRVDSNLNGVVIRDNVLCAFSGLAAINDPGNIAQKINNQISDSCSEQQFTDYDNDDFSLTANSPSRNSGSASGHPADDIIGVTRPLENRSDQGAYEFEPVGSI